VRSGQWSEDSSERFTSFSQYLSGDISKSPSAKLLRKTVDLHNVKTMLSIGCGNGRRELALMSEFPVTADFIEPSALMRAQLINNLHKHRGPGKPGQIFCGTFEEFAGEKIETSETRYDFVYAVHSFYFLRDPIEGVQQALKFLKPGGHLVIVLHMEGGFGRRFIEEFDHAGTQGGMTAEWLHQQIEITCEMSIIETLLPYQDFVEGDGLSPMGKTYVAFFAFRDWKTFSSSEVRRARQIVDQFSDGKMIREKFGQLHIRVQGQLK
jgi:SAM-dependent methyltransferase